MAYSIRNIVKHFIRKFMVILPHLLQIDIYNNINDKIISTFDDLGHLVPIFKDHLDDITLPDIVLIV
jgi:hypothetical protein